MHAFLGKPVEFDADSLYVVPPTSISGIDGGWLPVPPLDGFWVLPRFSVWKMLLNSTFGKGLISMDTSQSLLLLIIFNIHQIIS